MLIYKAFGWVYHIHNLTFSDQISIKNHTFSDALFWASFFNFLARLDAKNARFRETLSAQVNPKWHPKPPKWRQKGTSFSRTVPFFCRLASMIAFGPLLGTSLVDFGRIVDGFWSFVCIICCRGQLFGICFKRAPLICPQGPNFWNIL